MLKIDHYMVDYLDDAGTVKFASDRHLATLADAKALARKTSRKHGGASAVAFYATVGGFFAACGAVSYTDGHVSDVDGQVIQPPERR
jgi:hypothetical protein